MLLDDIQNMPKPTAQEHAVIEYILKHPETVATSTVRELARASHTSAPTIVRLCQKLGFSGFPEFRLQFVTEQKANQKGFYADFTHALVSKEASPKDIQRVLPQFYNSIAHETNALMTPERLGYFKTVIKGARVVDIYATGANFHVASRGAFLFESVGVPCSVYDEPNVHMIERLGSESGHISLLISHTGSNVKILEVARVLLACNQPTIAIVGRQASPLADLADAVIELYCTPMFNQLQLLSHAISLGYVFDLLYTALLCDELGSMPGESSLELYSLVGREQTGDDPA